MERVARHANARTFTLGVALAPCSLPQTRRANFDIAVGEMEIGMGIHGEPGMRREPLRPADAADSRPSLPLRKQRSGSVGRLSYTRGGRSQARPAPAL